jgi:hypothetical protein
MFERLRIQANIRRLIDNYGMDTALELYRTALEREFSRAERREREKDNSVPSQVV